LEDLSFVWSTAQNKVENEIDPETSPGSKRIEEARREHRFSIFVGVNYYVCHFRLQKIFKVCQSTHIMPKSYNTAAIRLTSYLKCVTVTMGDFRSLDTGISTR